jgi:hypothetical protein
MQLNKYLHLFQIKTAIDQTTKYLIALFLALAMVNDGRFIQYSVEYQFSYNCK